MDQSSSTNGPDKLVFTPKKVVTQIGTPESWEDIGPELSPLRQQNLSQDLDNSGAGGKSIRKKYKKSKKSRKGKNKKSRKSRKGKKKKSRTSRKGKNKRSKKSRKSYRGGDRMTLSAGTISDDRDTFIA